MNDLQCQVKAQEVAENVIWQWCEQEKITPRVVDIVEDALRWAYTEGQHDLQNETKQAVDEWINQTQSVRFNKGNR